MKGWTKKVTTNKLQASITVEAALVLPIFLFAMYTFLFFIQVLYIHGIIQNGLLETSQYCEKIGFLYDYIENYEENGSNQGTAPQNGTELEETQTNNSSGTVKKVAQNVITSSLIRSKFMELVDCEQIEQSCVINGAKGLNFTFSSYDLANDEVNLIVQYQVHIPIGLKVINDFWVKQNLTVKAFVGTKEEPEQEKGEEDEDYVYITETGTVYHESKECTHLKLSIKQVNVTAIDGSRNYAGAKYYACEVCNPKDTNQSYYYITTQGNRYHCNINCSGLKRTIKTIKRSDIGNRKACTRCGGK
ncbi:TadE family protein [Anaerosporobacter faecicola]|uniref:TadE family protein n=1 Tax=Anaerosporobacter faecicola TaxID=2718714 RepID=UPI00143AFDF3|nr:TadE family protein [Anaerosporobacter faecicola]